MAENFEGIRNSEESWAEGLISASINDYDEMDEEIAWKFLLESSRWSR